MANVCPYGTIGTQPETLANSGVRLRPYSFSKIFYDRLRPDNKRNQSREGGVEKAGVTEKARVTAVPIKQIIEGV